MPFLYGVFGTLAVLLLLIGGGFAGWTIRAAWDRYNKPKRAVDTEAIEKERKMLKEQQEAFHALQNYSTERAYGMTLADDLLSGGDS